MSPVKPAPTEWKGIVRQLGPGLIISANIVGSGELIVTTKLGADVGFMLLWFIIFGCTIKVFLQVELGRYAISKGKTTLEAMNSVPGPRFSVFWPGQPWRAEASWLVWCWLLMFVATFFQISGMVGGIAGVFNTGIPALTEAPGWFSQWYDALEPEEIAMKWEFVMNVFWAILITGSCAVLLFIGRYGFIEKFATTMVAIFTLFTIFAVFSLYWTEFGIRAENLAQGFRFGLPEDFTTAFAAFGVIGVGAAELIYYPYWCLEKGYAKYVGPKDDSPEWPARARGWVRVLKWDAWLSMVIYTSATLAFYLLGAAVLHSQGLEVTDEELIPVLSNLYRASFDLAGLWIFLVGAFVVLYSTIFISTASNARLSADLIALFKIVRIHTPETRRTLIRWACVILPALYFIFYVTVGKPYTLVAIGAVAQALMLPFLCFAALYFHYCETEEELKPGRAWMGFLWLSAVLMTAVGLYQFVKQIG